MLSHNNVIRGQKILRLVSPLGQRDRNKYLQGASFLIPKSNIVLDAGFTFITNQSFNKQILYQNNQSKKNITPNWSLAPDKFNLFITHAHEDHYAGIYSLPKNKKFNLFIGKFTYKIIRQKSEFLDLKLPSPERLIFLENKKIFKIGNFSIMPIKIKHNIPDNFGFVIKSKENRILYFPDYKEEFWKKLDIKSNDLVIIDPISALPQKIKGRFDFENIQKFLSKKEKIVFVDYGWDFETIFSFLKIAENLKRKIFLSPNVSSNLTIYPTKRLKNIIKLKRLAKPKNSAILICDLSELKKMTSGLRRQSADIGVVSNHYDLSAKPEKYLKGNKKNSYLNIFEGGHIDKNSLLNFVKKNNLTNSVRIEYI